jgi:guanylate kinase
MDANQGKCIIVSAPSGAGKTTIVRFLLERIPELLFSVSATSRPPRLNEVDGVDYHFLSPESFRKNIDTGAFLEWEEVYAGRYYGTPKSELTRAWNQGKHIIFDLDVVGGSNLKKHFGDVALAIFVQPPSIEILEQRLRNRSTENEENIRIRLDKAAYELTFSKYFDQILVNDNLEDACAKAEAMVRKFIEA